MGCPSPPLADSPLVSPLNPLAHNSSRSKPSIGRHPLVTTLLWLWGRFNVQDPDAIDRSSEDNNSNNHNPSPAGSGNNKHSGVLWQEEYGGHLDLYAEYFEEMKKSTDGGQAGGSDGPMESKPSAHGSPFTTPSPMWGWFVAITPDKQTNTRASKKPAVDKDKKETNISGTEQWREDCRTSPTLLSISEK